MSSRSPLIISPTASLQAAFVPLYISCLYKVIAPGRLDSPSFCAYFPLSFIPLCLYFTSPKERKLPWFMKFQCSTSWEMRLFYVIWVHLPHFNLFFTKAPIPPHFQFCFCYPYFPVWPFLYQLLSKLVLVTNSTMDAENVVHFGILFNYKEKWIHELCR